MDLTSAIGFGNALQAGLSRYTDVQREEEDRNRRLALEAEEREWLQKNRARQQQAWDAADADEAAVVEELVNAARTEDPRMKAWHSVDPKEGALSPELVNAADSFAKEASVDTPPSGALREVWAMTDTDGDGLPDKLDPNPESFDVVQPGAIQAASRSGVSLQVASKEQPKAGAPAVSTPSVGGGRSLTKAGKAGAAGVQLPLTAGENRATPKQQTVGSSGNASYLEKVEQTLMQKYQTARGRMVQVYEERQKALEEAGDDPQKIYAINRKFMKRAQGIKAQLDAVTDDFNEVGGKLAMAKFVKDQNAAFMSLQSLTWDPANRKQELDRVFSQFGEVFESAGMSREILDGATIQDVTIEAADGTKIQRGKALVLPSGTRVPLTAFSAFAAGLMTRDDLMKHWSKLDDDELQAKQATAKIREEARIRVGLNRTEGRAPTAIESQLDMERKLNGLKQWFRDRGALTETATTSTINWDKVPEKDKQYALALDGEMQSLAAVIGSTPMTSGARRVDNQEARLDYNKQQDRIKMAEKLIKMKGVIGTSKPLIPFSKQGKKAHDEMIAELEKLDGPRSPAERAELVKMASKMDKEEGAGNQGGLPQTIAGLKTK